MTKVPNHIKCLDITWEGHADCQHCAIRKYDILADVNIVKYEHLLKRIIQFSYSEKAMLFVENSPAKDLFVIRKGLVKLEDTIPDGSARIVRIVKKGGVAGLEAFLNHHQRYDQTAIALQDTEVCRIPHQILVNILDNEPNFYKAVLNEWHDQLEASSKVVVEFSTGTLRQRIARVLLMLIDEADRNKQLEITLLHIDDIAALTGVTRESVSRIMAELKRNKLLTKSGPNKMCFDESGIRKIAQPESA